MAVFFLLIGLEVKREVVEGHLSSWSQVALPGVAAVGGMAVPALVYVSFNYDDAFALKGWAIPTATRSYTRLYGRCLGWKCQRHRNS